MAKKREVQKCDWKPIKRHLIHKNTLLTIKK